MDERQIQRRRRPRDRGSTVPIDGQRQIPLFLCFVDCGIGRCIDDRLRLIRPKQCGEIAGRREIQLRPAQCDDFERVGGAFAQGSDDLPVSSCDQKTHLFHLDRRFASQEP